MPATFHFYLREDRPNKRGLCPVYLRITHNRKSKLIHTGIRLKPDDWNEKKEQVSGTYSTNKKEVEDLNDEIAIMRSDAEKAYRELRREKQVSADAIKKRVQYTSKDNFFDLSDEYLKEIKPDSFYNWKQSRVAFEKLKKFNKSDDLKVNTITPAKLVKFIRYLKNDVGNVSSTIEKNLGAIRNVLDKAVLQKLIPDNPMNDLSFTKQKQKLMRSNSNDKQSKTKLSFDQIKAIESLELQPGSNLWHARNVFILSYYFAGCRIGDMCCLKWENVKNGVLKYNMNKTGHLLEMKIPDRALKYLEMYDKDSEYIFPFLTELSPKQLEDSEQVRKKIDSWGSKINGKSDEGNETGLKKIAIMAGINENISMHCSRHSFAQYMIEEREITVYRLMGFLGHKSIKTTMQYLRSIGVSIPDEIIDDAWA